MASKSNIRSIRISEDMTALIDQQVGANFTEKWENLVTRCIWELPKQEERLKDIQERIKKEQQRLYDLQRATEKLRELEQNIKTAQFYFGIIERQAKQIAEAAERT